MGSSGEDPSKGIDASVGGLVWVRRRNGSWWPGKILSPDELPEGCVPTPRAGTPVKLLGREDASVDWYNLEKSKRIKAFHCGEYEDCIEKAKSAGSHLSKKGVKYARREDAILHALELESVRLGKEHPDISATTDTQNGEQHHVEEHPSEENGGVDKDLNRTEDDSDSAREPSQSGVSFEEPDRMDSAKKEPKLRRTPNDSEDDGAGGVKRMKGLDDLGMGAASSLKRKRSQVAHVHEFLKKKNRRRTLTKVLESTTMLPVPVVDERLSSPAEPSVPIPSDYKTSQLEPNESKSSNSVLVNNNSDSNHASCENGTLLNASGHINETALGSRRKDSENSSMLGFPSKESVQRSIGVPLVQEEKQSAGTSLIPSDESQKVVVTGAQSGQTSHTETLSLGNEEHNESGSTSSGAANGQQISDKIEKGGTSEWQLKGKRNSRSRKVDVDNDAETYAAGADEYANLVGRSASDDTGSDHIKSRPITEIQVEEFRGWSRNSLQKEAHRKGSTVELPIPQRTLPYRQSRFTVNPKYDSSDFSLSRHITGSGMHDVTVKVNTGHRPQHVPYISLMSKFNGQPIIGHPITVEVLDDGSCDDLISASKHQTTSSELNFNRSADIPALQGAGMAYKRRQRGRPPRKHGSHRPRRPLSKTPKSRRNGAMSKKIRKLSSLTTGSHRLSREQKKSVVEKQKGPSIACVPLTVVFSRINAALA